MVLCYESSWVVEKVQQLQWSDEVIEHIKQEAEKKMKECLDSLVLRLNKVRTGRATPEFVSNLKVSYYNSSTALSQLANISVEGSKTIIITPWDKGAVAAIEKAILTSNLGINPQTAGQVIRITLPPLSAERREELARIVREDGENACVTIRNARRHANQQLKDSLKAKNISKDEEHCAQGLVQKLTDDYVARINKLVECKEHDVRNI